MARRSAHRLINEAEKGEKEHPLNTVAVSTEHPIHPLTSSQASNGAGSPLLKFQRQVCPAGPSDHVAIMADMRAAGGVT